MKHKRFNEAYPYTYYLKNKITGQKYHGVRWGNVRLGVSPYDDLGSTYFSSGKLRESFKNCPDDYDVHIKWTFDTVEEARCYEDKINTKLMYKDDWEVWNNSKAIYNKISPSLGRLVRGTEIAQKIGKANKGKVSSEEFKKLQSMIQQEKVERGEHYFCSDKHAEKTSSRMTENNPSFGGLSAEHKRKIGDAQKGVPKPKRTEEHRKNLSESLKGNVPWNAGKKGLQSHTKETREKMSKSRKGKKHTKETLEKMSENAGGTKHLVGKKVCCVCCHREWDLGNYSKHIKVNR